MTSTHTNKKVNVSGGSYSGTKYFLKIPYKTIATDVEFADDRIALTQGTGAFKIKGAYTTEIKYRDILSVDVKKRYSTANIVLASIIVLGTLIGLVSEILVAIVAVAVAVYLGSTTAVIINYNYGKYEILNNFKSEADELKDKIYTAINQSK